MIDTHVEVENNSPSRKFTFKALREYESIMTRTAASVFCQIEYWWPRRKGPEFYKTDQEFADEMGISLSHFKAIKKHLSKKLKLFKTRTAFLKGKKVTYYGGINYVELDRLISDKKDTLKSDFQTLVKYENQTLLDQSKVRKSDFTRTKIRLCTLYTNNTTNITFNPAGLEKYLSSNESNLENSSSEQKSRSEENRIACREKIILEETPTPKSEESKQKEKAVGTFTIPLKAEDAEAPKKSKAKGKVSKPKVQATQINPDMPLTAELRKIALDVRFDGKGLKEGVIESVFEDFVDHYVANGVSRPRWDLSWKSWCKKAIELDKYHRKTIENPIRSGMTVSAATEEKVSIDSAFVGFVKEKLNGMQFEFEGATYAEVDDRIVIDQQNSFRRELIEKLKDRLQQYFGKEIELKWLRNSWVVPTVSKQETEIITPEVTEIVTSDVSVPSLVLSPVCVEKIPLETPPVFEASTLSQESSDDSGIDKTLNLLFKAMQERSGTVGEFKIDSNSPSEENNASSLTEKKNNKEVVENVSNENQFCPSEHASESNPVMISVSGEAILATDQLQPNEDLQQNRSEISITQLCLEFPKAISAKPVEEEIQLEVREEINNLPPSRISNPTSAIINSPIKLSKPKSALHLPKFPVTAAKSFLDFPSTAKRLSDYAEMIRVNLINTNLKKEMPPGLSKPPQKSSILERCDIIPAEMVNATQAVKNNQLGLR